jgi:hypothetical protein
MRLELTGWNLHDDMGADVDFAVCHSTIGCNQLFHPLHSKEIAAPIRASIEVTTRSRLDERTRSVRIKKQSLTIKLHPNQGEHHAY